MKSEEIYEEEFGIDRGVSMEMDEEMDEMDKMDEMDEEEDHTSLRTEKCLISVAKTCNLKSFCYDPAKKDDLIPIIVGKDKIKGGKCPGKNEQIDDYQLIESMSKDKCYHHHGNCSYCEENQPKVFKITM